MFEIKGSINTAKVFTNYLEESAFKQVLELMNSYLVDGSKIAIMPDSHTGAGCVIGLTMTITDKVCPNLVGCDVGCSMRVVELGKIDLDLKALDEFIHEYIPNGRDINDSPVTKFEPLKDLVYQDFDMDRALMSIGSLGGKL